MKSSTVRLVSTSSLPSGSGSLSRKPNTFTWRRGNKLLFHCIYTSSCVPSRPWLTPLNFHPSRQACKGRLFLYRRGEKNKKKKKKEKEKKNNQN